MSTPAQVHPYKFNSQLIDFIGIKLTALYDIVDNVVGSNGFAKPILLSEIKSMTQSIDRARQRSLTVCSNGNNCSYYKNGNCWFYHPPINLSSHPTHNNNNNNNPNTNRSANGHSPITSFNTYPITRVNTNPPNNASNSQANNHNRNINSNRGGKQKNGGKNGKKNKNSNHNNNNQSNNNTSNNKKRRRRRKRKKGNGNNEKYSELFDGTLYSSPTPNSEFDQNGSHVSVSPNA